MMNDEFIRANFQAGTYTLKEGTKGSYYWTEGFSELPNRLSISRDNELTKVSRRGRNLLHPIAGQMVGNFTAKESSPYKMYKPYTCRTQIWRVEDYPQFIGYGTMGITNEKGGIEDTGDLLLFYTPDDWEHIRIFHLAGMGNPENLLEAMSYASNHL